ncbi:DUF6359 domain-containing protein [Carboxylicivirga taeanensis]|uniref:DUF6359 domain-containing protein n=1 Tax=Carboxylicivirga taeanensis TaxID=1416875 RepID=UPI003F6E2E3F
MKKHLIYISIFFLSLIICSCVDETGDVIHKGKVQFSVSVPQTISDSDKEDYTIKVSFYREYNDVTVEAKLEIEKISTDGLIFTVPFDMEHGNWEVKQAVLLDKSFLPVYLAVTKDDERAKEIAPELLLPQSDNIVQGQLTTFDLQLVEFNPATDPGVDPPVTSLFYDFSDGTKYDKISLNGWLTIDAKAGADRGWSYNENSDTGNKYAQASGFNGTEANYTSWMITPPLDLDNTNRKIVSFKTAKAYWAASSEFKVYIMDSSDPLTANKTELTALLATEADDDHAWIESGDIDLSAYSGIRYIAFYYFGEGTTGSSTSFRVDDFIYGDVEDIPVEVDPVTSLFYDFSDGTKYDKIQLNGWLTVNKNPSADRGWSFNENSKNGNKYAQASGFNGTEANYTSWMISPPLDIEGAVNKTVSFKTAKAYWAASSQFKVYLIDGTNPETDNMVELSATLAGESDADHAWVESGSIDLSAYSGVKRIAFYYYGEGTTGSSTSFRVDDFTYGDYDAPEEPIIPVSELFYDFSDGVKNDVVMMSNWKTVNSIDGVDKQWSYNEFNGNMYAQMSGYNGDLDTYTSWLISPALDIDGATNKKVSFKTAKAYWSATTEFKVYLLNGTDPSTAIKIELTDALLASETDANNAWIESGEIDLSAYSGYKYIAFYYHGEGSTGGSTTFRVDDFTYGDYNTVPPVEGGTKEDPYTVEEAIGIQDNSKAWVQGYIVGFVVSGTPATVTKEALEITSDSNIAIATSAGETDTEKMIYVQLSGTGSAARTQLGLSSTAGASLGKLVKLNGNLTNYFDTHAGLKGVSTAEQFEIIPE